MCDEELQRLCRHYLKFLWKLPNLFDGLFQNFDHAMKYSTSSAVGIGRTCLTN